MKKALIIVLILVSLGAKAQTVVLQENLTDTVATNFGSNKRHHFHAVFGYDFFAGKENTDAPVRFGRSGGFNYGFRYKYKLGSVYSLGFDIIYQGLNYRFRQSKEKIFPDTLLHKSQSLSFSSFKMGIYNRINFDRHRGNITGKFLDVGFGYLWNFSVHYNVTDDQPDGSELDRDYSKLNYIQKFLPVIFTRLGYNRIIFTAQYLLENPLKANYSNIILPKLMVGVQLGFY